jgi:hypothetical protein
MRLFLLGICVEWYDLFKLIVNYFIFYTLFYFVFIFIYDGFVLIWFSFFSRDLLTSLPRILRQWRYQKYLEKVIGGVA